MLVNWALQTHQCDNFKFVIICHYHNFIFNRPYMLRMKSTVKKIQRWIRYKKVYPIKYGSRYEFVRFTMFALAEDVEKGCCWYEP